jgi:ABC-2 type transport system ATP-binding protein
VRKSALLTTEEIVYDHIKGRSIMHKISVNHFVKKFKEKTVLDDVSIDFEMGKIHGLVGRNGSGKTMLLKAICGFTPATSGFVSVGSKVVGKDIDIPDNLGVIIEAPGFLPQYSGFKNLALLAMIGGKVSKDEILSVIERVGLDPSDKKHVGRYSLGMRQRLGIAQAIMEDPDILLLDEPMNGLDNSGVEEMRKLFLELKAVGKTILLASHSKEDIEILCDTVTELDSGRVIKTESLP